MVTALARKLLRDLLRAKGQVATIAIVVGCGVASYVTLQGAYGSLLRARDAYYESSRFADVFVHLERAPESVLSRVEGIAGVAVAESRLVEGVTLPLPGLSEPATGLLIGVPPGGETRLNQPLVREGRTVQPGAANEVVLLESFARAHGFRTGSSLPVVMNGVLRALSVVGTAASPEYVVPTGGGEVFGADERRFAALWMDRSVVASAFRMEGAFDDVTLRLQRGVNEENVIAALRSVLSPYGAFEPVKRSRQLSNYMVSSELAQLESYTTVAPLLFLGVAAFLVNVVLSRLVELQRPQIATLSALGYGGFEIARHYLTFVLVIVGFGSALGVAAGVWLGDGMLGMYSPYFKFPALTLVVDARIIATSLLVSGVTAVGGAFFVLRRVSRLPPAEAMQPEAPPTYKATLLERLGLGRVFSGAGRMVLRDLLRRPLRLGLSSLGIATGIAVVIVGRFAWDAMDVILTLQFEGAQREDVAISFSRPVDASALGELAHAPGVLRVEPLRLVPARLRAGPRSYEVALTGRDAGGELRRTVEWPYRVVPLPEDGVMLSDALARKLGVAAGDVITVELLEGSRRVREVVVSAIAGDVFGMNATMTLPSLRALVGEGPVVSSALLSVDPTLAEDLDRRLMRAPAVAGVARRSKIIALFRKQTAESMHVTTLVLTLFGSAIAIGVVYNSARVALSLRGRDLASLRVLGLTRAEISRVLLGEMATYVVLAIVPGLALGRVLVGLMMSGMDREMVRMPVVVTSATYLFGVTVTVVAAVLSALLVRRQLDRLDLVAVLKARE